MFLREKSMTGGNGNHPKKGSSIKVGPIMDLADVVRIKGSLKNPMHRALFTVGVNTNLRASDLVRLKVGQVRGLNSMDSVEIKEKKTGKPRIVTFNGECVRVLSILIEGRGDEELLFPLRVSSVHRLVKGWCKGLKGNYGSHTLRKTFGYHQRKTFGVSLPVLTKVFNHASQGQTLEYLCVQPEEIRDIYRNEI